MRRLLTLLLNELQARNLKTAPHFCRNQFDLQAGVLKRMLDCPQRPAWEVELHSSVPLESRELEVSALSYRDMPQITDLHRNDVCHSCNPIC